MTALTDALNTFVNALPGNISQGLIWGILAIGVYITYKILDFPDLSVDGSITTGAAVSVILILKGVPVPIAMLCAFLAGCLAGLCTGLMNTLLGIPGILAGILTQIALYSVNLAIMGKANVPVSVDNFPLFVSQRYTSTANTPLVVALEVGKIVLVVVVIIAVMYWFFGTEYGFTIRSTGCNANMARAQGINTKKSTVVALVLSNGIVGFAGGVLVQYAGNADVNMGRGAIVIGLAAVIIGDVLGRVIFGKHFNFVARLAFTAFGAVVYFIVLQIVMLIPGITSTYNKLFSALIVMIFLAVPYIKNSAKTSFGRAARNSRKQILSEGADESLGAPEAAGYADEKGDADDAGTD